MVALKFQLTVNLTRRQLSSYPYDKDHIDMISYVIFVRHLAARCRCFQPDLACFRSAPDLSTRRPKHISRALLELLLDRTTLDTPSPSRSTNGYVKSLNKANSTKPLDVSSRTGNIGIAPWMLFKSSTCTKFMTSTRHFLVAQKGM